MPAGVHPPDVNAIAWKSGDTVLHAGSSPSPAAKENGDATPAAVVHKPDYARARPPGAIDPKLPMLPGSAPIN